MNSFPAGGEAEPQVVQLIRDGALKHRGKNGKNIATLGWVRLLASFFVEKSSTGVPTNFGIFCVLPG
jgi:hypothetical protein